MKKFAVASAALTALLLGGAASAGSASAAPTAKPHPRPAGVKFAPSPNSSHTVTPHRVLLGPAVAYVRSGARVVKVR